MLLLLLLLLLLLSALKSGLMFCAVFSIHASRSRSPSMFGTVESAPIEMPTMDARSSNASWLAVKSRVSSLVIAAGGLDEPLEVTSDGDEDEEEEDADEEEDDVADEDWKMGTLIDEAATPPAGGNMPADF
jgi:hypothetical protein